MCQHARLLAGASLHCWRHIKINVWGTSAVKYLDPPRRAQGPSKRPPWHPPGVPLASPRGLLGDALASPWRRPGAALACTWCPPSVPWCQPGPNLAPLGPSLAPPWRTQASPRNNAFTCGPPPQAFSRSCDPKMIEMTMDGPKWPQQMAPSGPKCRLARAGDGRARAADRCGVERAGSRACAWGKNYSIISRELFPWLLIRHRAFGTLRRVRMLC